MAVVTRNVLFPRYVPMTSTGRGNRTDAAAATAAALETVRPWLNARPAAEFSHCGAKLFNGRVTANANVAAAAAIVSFLTTDRCASSLSVAVYC